MLLKCSKCLFDFKVGDKFFEELLYVQVQALLFAALYAICLLLQLDRLSHAMVCPSPLRLYLCLLWAPLHDISLLGWSRCLGLCSEPL